MILKMKLKDLRKRQDNTQQQIADSLKISQVSYARYESGSRKPSFKLIGEIALYYNVSIEYLLDDRIYNIEHANIISKVKYYLLIKEKYYDDIELLKEMKLGNNPIEKKYIDDMDKEKKIDFQKLNRLSNELNKLLDI